MGAVGAGVRLEELLPRLNIIDIVRAAGVEGGRQRGDQLEQCSCPLCNDRSHFGINVKSSLWKCHKCGEGGNIITFVGKVRELPTGAAFREVMKMAGMEVRPEPKPRVAKTVKPKAGAATAAASVPGTAQRTPAAAESKATDPARDADAAAVYEEFVRRLTLTDAHRQELKQKRGFTQTTIETFRLRSGGTYVVEILTQLAASFGEATLLNAALMVTLSGHSQHNPQLLEDRVIIPYLDEQGAVYHVRPHKLGLTGLAIQAYCRYMLKEQPATVVLSEGEFKTMALQQWGIPGIALPGVSSFGGRYFEALVALLKEHGVKTVTIVFDSEDKGDPALPNYKAKAEDRYGTEAWAYIMAWKLGREGLVARIGELPAEWRQNGKVDLDGALAQGRTRRDIEAVIAAARLPREYLDGLPGEASIVVRRQVDRHFAKSRLSVRREFSKYIATRTRGGQTYEQVISNFVIEIRSSFVTAEGIIRMVQFVNEYSERSTVFPLDPGEMAGLNEFRRFAFGHGNYTFMGTMNDLTELWQLEFLRDSSEFILMPDRIGRVEPNLWLFGNCAVYKGRLYRPDTDGIVWLGGERGGRARGYKPQSLQLGPRDEPVEDAIPALSAHKADAVAIAGRLRAAVGGYEAYVGMGWVIACLFGEDIFREYKCLPILFAHGKRESGKSTYLRWLMHFFGIETEGYGISESTQNFIARALSYYSGLGVWFDEYRNEPRVTMKDGYFRSAYNRQLSGKGTPTAFQARGFAVHAAVALSGEELPRDNGLYTRLVPLQLSAHKWNRAEFNWLNRHCVEFSAITRDILTRYDELRDPVLRAIAELKAALVERDISDRTAENWAICAGAFEAVVVQDEGFIHWVLEACQEVRRAAESEHALSIFWDDINALLATRELDGRYLKVDVDENKLCLWFPGIYNVWATHFRRRTGREPFDRTSIRKYFEDEPYYVGEANRHLDGPQRRCCIVDLAKTTIPSIQEVAESALTAEAARAAEHAKRETSSAPPYF